MHEESFAPGQVLAGRYRVERVIGKGGMGVVLAVRHLQLGSLSAMKFMLESTHANPELADRFIREARAAASLKGENVARVNDFGQLDSGAPYIVMEYLEGTDLDEELRRDAPTPPREAVSYVRQACQAMMEAHALGIVHRDLKPQNLFLTKRPDGTPLVKVLDFGISKSNDAASISVTTSSAVMGSPLYMSPEQVKSSRGVDARGDIYALGVILYQLVAGMPPFYAESAGELFALILMSPASPLATVAPDLPRELGVITERCLRKNREERYQSVAELDAALAQIESIIGSVPQPYLGSPAYARTSAAPQSPPAYSAPFPPGPPPYGAGAPPLGAGLPPFGRASPFAVGSSPGTQPAPYGQPGPPPIGPRPPYGASGAGVPPNTLGGGAHTLLSAASDGHGAARRSPWVWSVAAGVLLVVCAGTAVGLYRVSTAPRNDVPKEKAIATARTAELHFEKTAALPAEGASVVLGDTSLGKLTAASPTIKVPLAAGESLFDVKDRLRVQIPSTCTPLDTGVSIPFATREETEGRFGSEASVVVEATLKEFPEASIYFDNAGGTAGTISIGRSSFPVAAGASGVVHTPIGSCVTGRVVSASAKSIGVLDVKGTDDAFVVDLAGGHCYEGRTHSYMPSGAGVSGSGPVALLRGARIYRTGRVDDFLASSPNAIAATQKPEIRAEILRCPANVASGARPPGKTGYAVGDAVDVEWHGTWYPSHVLVVSGDQYKIHYDGWGANYDEVVPTSRIRKK